MKNLIYALILSTLIHLIFLFNIELKKEEPKELQKSSSDKKYNIDYVKLKSSPKKSISEEKPKELIKDKKEPKIEKQNDIPKQEMKKNLKESIKKDVEKFFKKVDKQNLKTLKEIEKQKANTLEEIKTPPKPKVEVKENSLSSFLSTPVVDNEIYDELTKSYLALYGEEFTKFTKIQKAYLKKHLNDIGKITQHYLSYPEIAVLTKQSGMNIVEFYLYPNGDISDLKLLKSSSYSALDKNSIKTIEIAYKDYPKPKEKTLVRIYIHYNLF